MASPVFGPSASRGEQRGRLASVRGPMTVGTRRGPADGRGSEGWFPEKTLPNRLKKSRRSCTMGTIASDGFGREAPFTTPLVTI